MYFMLLLKQFFVLVINIKNRTTLGATLVGESGVLLSVEDYFVERGLKFDPKKLPDARKWNLDRTLISFDVLIY